MKMAKRRKQFSIFFKQFCKFSLTVNICMLVINQLKRCSFGCSFEVGFCKYVTILKLDFQLEFINIHNIKVI